MTATTPHWPIDSLEVDAILQALGDVVCDLIDEEAQESAYAFVALEKLADDFQADVQRLLQEVPDSALTYRRSVFRRRC
jgi:hypothetical protein